MNSFAKAGLIVHSTAPFNAEPPLDRLRAAAVTPVELFYVRSHGAVPAIDPAQFRLRVDGLVDTPLELSLDGLQRRFAERRVTAAMQCAGNRRGDLQQVRPTLGDPWAPGAIGNAVWSGAALAEVLAAAGLRPGAGHVVFEAADECEAAGEGRFQYEVSVPLEKAMAPEVLLAWGMNGAPLTPEHGAPLRAVVPGFAGVRSAKWLRRLVVQAAPSDGRMQARDYRMFPPEVTAETADWASAAPIEAMPLNSAICEPAPCAHLPAGPVRVRGYATASGREIRRVDVSGDGGRSWVQAALEQDPGSCWAWTLWETSLELAPGAHELVVRAWDSAGQTQPSAVADVWNFKGYLCAAWHRVPVVVD